MKPFISIFLNRTYRLRLTFGVILEYEQLTESQLRDLRWNDSGAMVALLWMMLRQEVKSITLEQTAALVKAQKYRKEIFKAIRQAVMESFTDRKDSAEAPEKKEKGCFDYPGIMRQAADIGLPQSELWTLTPAEFTETCRAYHRKIVRERNESIAQAWYGVYFGLLLNNNKHMPQLSEHLTDPDAKAAPAREMTDDEMKTACEMICAAFGGKVVET